VSDNPPRPRSRRAFVGWLFAGIGVIAAFRFRLFQVGSFVAASALRRVWRQDDRQTTVTSLTPTWSGHDRSRQGASGTTARTAITYHPWYQQFNVEAVSLALAHAADLGVDFIRTDVRWSDLYPDGQTLSTRAAAWYDAYFSTAQDRYGIQPLIVLGNPPTALGSLPLEHQLIAWNKYVRTVASTFATRCTFYQLLNEPNNPVYSFWSPEHTASAIKGAAGIIRGHTPSATLAINVALNLPRWRHYTARLLEHTDDVLDLLGLDSYPSTWSISLADATSLVALMSDVRAQMRAIGVRKIRIGIMETGYATNLPFVRNEEDQAAFYRQMLQMIRAVPSSDIDATIPLFGLYELCDQNSSVYLDPEASFGLVHSDLKTRKTAFAAAQEICRDLKR
jgi:hypothetical protein